MTDKEKKSEEAIDRELELLLEEMPEQEDFEKKMNRYIKRKIQKITVKTVLVMGLIAIILFLMISPAMDRVYLNPAKQNEDQTYVKVLRDYYDLTMPYIEIGNIRVDKKGFGRYELGIEAYNTMKSRNFGLETIQVDVELGEYKNWQDPERILVTMLGMFDYPIEKEDRDRLLSEFEKLPESAQISLAVSETEAREVKELRKEKVQLDWIEVYHPNHPDFQGGINLQKAMLSEESDKREEMTEEELLKVYTENLKNLAEHPEIWKSLGLPFHSTVWSDGTEIMWECYEDAKTLKNLETKAYYISGQRDDILEYLKKTELKSINVYKVKSNIWDW